MIIGKLWPWWHEKICLRLKRWPKFRRWQIGWVCEPLEDRYQAWRDKEEYGQCSTR
jgi:hypothetical protein